VRDRPDGKDDRDWAAIMIKILLAEDQGMVQDALATLLDMEEDMEVVARLASGDRVVRAATALHPDVALLDIEMPGMDGLTAATELHRVMPECKILILTTFDRPGYLRRAMQAGAAGFMVKDGPVEALAQAIRGILEGKQVIDPALAAIALRTEPDPLSPRERDVLAAAAGGSSVAGIAAQLFLSEGTVRNYLSSAIQKVGAHNRLEAIRIAEQKGWL
jgi:two-component system response regulator DesR